MLFRQIYDDKLAQYAYLIGCQATGEALVIDPERDVDRYVDLAARESLEISAVTETHIHADFLSGTREFAERYGTRVYLSGEGDDDSTYTWPGKGDYDVVMLKDGDSFHVGNIRLEARHTPGHTPEHLSFLITDVGGGADQPMGIASGDSVFVGALGRPDLLETAAGQKGAREPAARALYRSVQRFLKMDDYLQVWPGHGSGSACGKALGSVPESTVGYEKRFNASIDAAMRGEAAFVEHILEGQPEPPLYFARMKRLNREGVPLLGGLPWPRRLTSEELGAFCWRTDVAVVDTRPDRSEFMKAHLPGSLYAPLDRSFSTVVASYVEPGTPVCLILDEPRLEEAVRDLVRVGIDDVPGYATPDALEEIGRSSGRLDAIEEIVTADLEVRRRGSRTAVVDVRGLDEYQAGHVPDAYLAPHVRLPAMIHELPRDEELLVYCRTGHRAAPSAAFLRRCGYDVVYVNGLVEACLQANAAARPVT